jgi:epoxyqueuosine reductase
VDDLRTRVIARGRRAGLDAVGVAGVEPFTRARADLERRRDAGLHGGMAFTYRNPARSTDPRRTMADAGSLVVAALRYPSAVGAPPAGAGTGVPGRVARYATADHYAVLRAGLGEMADELAGAGHRAVVLADDNALVDRAAAHRAGLGWFGKNANLLLADRGSWFVLGSVLTDAVLEPAAAPLDDGCGPCRRCLDGCPTGAIVAPGVVDARRCLAWHLQVAGEFPREFRTALGDRIYGCDDCQEVCPPNRAADARGEGAADPDTPGRAHVDVLWMLAATDDELWDRLGRWYVPRREARYLRRNALVVLGNTGDPDRPDVEQALRRALRDDDDLVCAHAAWAARRLGRTDLLEEPDVASRAAVRTELAAEREAERAAASAKGDAAGVTAATAAGEDGSPWPAPE